MMVGGHKLLRLGIFDGVMQTTFWTISQVFDELSCISGIRYQNKIIPIKGVRYFGIFIVIIFPFTTDSVLTASRRIFVHSIVWVYCRECG